MEDVTIHVLQKVRRHPLPFKMLQKEIARKLESHRASALLSVLEGLAARGVVVAFGAGEESEYFLTANFDWLKHRLCAVLKSHHTKYPYEPGMRTGDIKKRFSETKTLNAKINIDARLFALTMSACTREGLIVESDRGVRLSDFTPQSREDEETATLEEAVLKYVADRLFTRIGIEELSGRLEIDTRRTKALLSGMVKAGRLIRIEENRYFEPAALEHVKDVLIAELRRRPKLRLSEIVTLLGQSRSATVPLVEYFDRIGLTRRNGEYREAGSGAVKESFPPEDRIRCPHFIFPVK